MTGPRVGHFKTAPVKVRRLADLYIEAQCAYYGPIIEQLERDGKIGANGITASDLASIPPFMNLERFIIDLRERGIPFKP